MTDSHENVVDHIEECVFMHSFRNGIVTFTPFLSERIDAHTSIMHVTNLLKCNFGRFV